MMYKQDFPIHSTNLAPSYLGDELSKIDGYEHYICGNRVVENGRPVLGEDGTPVTVDRYIKVYGSDDMDESAVKTVIDKYIADYPAYAEAKQAEFNAQDYARTREDKYPSWQDQLDQIFHEGIDKWKETIQAVKDAHPKP